MNPQPSAHYALLYVITWYVQSHQPEWITPLPSLLTLETWCEMWFTTRKTQEYPRREGDNDSLKRTTLINSFECCKENFVTFASENGTLTVSLLFSLILAWISSESASSLPDFLHPGCEALPLIQWFFSWPRSSRLSIMHAQKHLAGAKNSVLPLPG